METFDKFWPDGSAVISYVEVLEPGVSEERLRLLSSCVEAVEFVARHRDDPAANGRSPNATWTEKQRIRGYNQHFDAVKWSRQAFIPFHAAQLARTEYLVWFDADVVFTDHVDPLKIEAFLPSSAHIAFVGRLKHHPDIGFQIYRLPQALPFLKVFSDLYKSDEVFNLTQWHSAYVWREALRRCPIASVNLAPHALSDAWPASPLSAFSIHRHGPRKFDPWP